MARDKFVSYIRVSTQRQGRSGLGLEAQREAVNNYLNGGNWTLIAEMVEIESGKRIKNRPKLTEALSLCRIHGATLVVAKLDRLARNVVFISTLMESGMAFIAVDLPQANKLTVHIMSAMAEYEAAAISTRTKEALAAAKARGTKLGGYRWAVSTVAQTGGIASGMERGARATKRAHDLMPIVNSIREGGATSLRQIAAGLKERGITTPRGEKSAWTAAQVHRLLARMGSPKMTTRPNLR